MSTSSLQSNHSYRYLHSTSPASSSGTSSSDSSSAPTPPPYTSQQLDVDSKKNPYPDLTTTKPMDLGLSAKYGAAPRKASRLHIAHPYARLVAKKGEVKRRKIWNHALEKSLFSPYEISTLGAPHRRGIYTASLESHIDELHNQLLEIGYWPVPFESLEPYKGLNSKTAKSMVANLQHNAAVANLKLLELERSNHDLRILLKQSDLP